MMWPNPFNPYEGGPTVIEWLKQVCDKFNELLTAIKNVRELPAGGSHGQVPTPKEDGSGYEWVDQSGGGGGGDVTASGNNVFTGTNHFEGLTVLAETHVPTAKDDNDATNKLYVDTLVSNTKKTTVDEVNAHTDERVNALRVLPAGGTSGQVPTIAPDGSTVEWKTPDTGGGGSDDLWYPTITTAGIISWAKSSTTTPPASRNIKGPQGNDGTPGKDGVSPTASVVQTETGATVTVTDASGTTTAKLTNGAPGADGAPGKDGTTPTFEVGTVTKLSPDAEPTVTLEDVGGGLYMIDYGIPQGQPGTPGTGSGDVVAAGNNVFTGTNHFEGLTVLGETHAETPTDDNDVTNKLYVDTLAGTTKTSAVTEADAHTDDKINALRTLPAGGTSGQVPTIASDGASVEWQTPSGGGGGGVEWVEVALTNGANTAGEVHLFYDKADNTHLKMVGYFTSSSNLQAVSFTLPDANPIDYGHRVVAALPTSTLNLRNSIYLTGVSFNGTAVTIESYTSMSSSYYRFVGTEFYVVTSAPQTDEGLPEPTDVPLPDPTLGE